MKNGKGEKKRRGFIGTMYNVSTNTEYNTVKAKEKSRFPLSVVICAVIATLLFMYIVFSFMQISQIKSDMADMNSEIHALQREEKKISTELEGKYSSKIESLAYDMGLSGKNSGAIYLDNGALLEVTEIIYPEKTPGSASNSLMSAVSRSFRKFLEFMD